MTAEASVMPLPERPSFVVQAAPIVQDTLTEQMLRRAELAARLFVSVPMTEAELEDDPDYGF